MARLVAWFGSRRCGPVVGGCDGGVVAVLGIAVGVARGLPKGLCLTGVISRNLKVLE